MEKTLLFKSTAINDFPDKIQIKRAFQNIRFLSSNGPVKLRKNTTCNDFATLCLLHHKKLKIKL
jgi:hypothetical protein